MGLEKLKMSFVRLPEPDLGIIGRRNIIVDDIARLIGRDSLITDEDGRRAFETDALTAYRRLPLLVAAAVNRGCVQDSALLSRQRAEGHSARSWYVVVWRCAAGRRRGGDLRFQTQPCARRRFCQSRDAG